MSTRYRYELRNKVRNYLHNMGRVDDAESIEKSTSIERLRSLLSFHDKETMYEFFDHEPIVRNPEGGPDLTSIPCYLILAETSVETIEFDSGKALVDYIGLDPSSTRVSIHKALWQGGARLKIGKYHFSISRRETRDISSIPESTNNHLNIRVAAMLEGVPKRYIDMRDIAKYKDIHPGRYLVKRLCECFGIKHHPHGIGGPRVRRHTTLTNLHTGETRKFSSIEYASSYLRVSSDTLIDICSRGDTISLYEVFYSIHIDYSEED